MMSRRQQNQHEGLGHSMPVPSGPLIGQWSWTPSHDRIELDPEWQEHLGWCSDDLVRLQTLGLRSLLPPGDIAAAARAQEAVLAGAAQTVDVSIRVNRRDGSACWVRVVGFVTARDADGTVRGMRGTIEDVGAKLNASADASGQLAAINKAHLVSEFDLQGTLLSANANFLETFGYTLPELIGRHHSVLVDERTASSHPYREFWDRLNRGEYDAGRYKRIGKGGREIWIQATYNPILDAAGRPYKVVKYASDISEQQRRLTDMDGQLAAIDRAQLTMEFGLDGTVRTANRAALDVFGYRIDEIWGKPHCMLLVQGEADSADHEALWEALRRGEFAAGVYRRRSKGGRELWLQAVYSPILDPAGRPWKVVKYATDVTARIATESALRNSELKLRALFDLSPVGMALINVPSGRFEQVNDGLVQFLGYSREDMLGMTYASLTHPGASGAEPFGLPGAIPGTRFGPAEYGFQRSDGTVAAALVAGIVVNDSQGVGQVWTIVQSIDEQKSIQEHLAVAALTDTLTGLPNRAAFVKALARAVERHHALDAAGFAVLFIDIDRFKLVNDTMGHAAGDVLLQHIAKRLRASVRQADRGACEEMFGMAARFGGDEFAVLMTDLRTPTAINSAAERLLTVLAQPYEIQGRTIHSSASVGIVSSSQGFFDAAEIMQRVDVAMYEAKHSGRARAVVFDEPMQSRLNRRLLLENDLREALRTDGVSVVYQPIVDLETGEMTSAEALVRWLHPTLGSISPAEFVPIAEESGLIVNLGQFVLREACAQFQVWHKSSPERAPKTISVNLSRPELALGQAFIEHLRETMSAVGIDPACLQLEVTEREIARNPALSLTLMNALKQTGVRLAMDDFGTGASSLSCLRNMPFDTVKIDQSFLSNLESERDVLMVLHATVTLIENLGMSSVAEGVERPTQVAFLQSIRCRHAQGYLFGQPVDGNLLTAVDCLGFRANAS